MDLIWINYLLAASNIFALRAAIAAHINKFGGCGWSCLLVLMTFYASIFLHLSERHMGIPGLDVLAPYEAICIWTDRVLATGCFVYGCYVFICNLRRLKDETEKKDWRKLSLAFDKLVKTAIVAFLILGAARVFRSWNLGLHESHLHLWIYCFSHCVWHYLAYDCLFQVFTL